MDLVEKTNSVTVNPLCPTNKIAPHKRTARYYNNDGRTFGAYYDLLAPGNIHNTPSSLQEEPQPDEPGDCGEIEDYDENDLSSSEYFSLLFFFEKVQENKCPKIFLNTDYLM